VGISEGMKSDEIAAQTEFHTLSRIRRFTAFDVFSLFSILQWMQQQLQRRESEYYAKLRLVMIDSLGTVLAPILSKHPVGHSLLSSLAALMKAMAQDHGLAFVYTNYMVSGRRDGELRPALGPDWAIVAHTTLMLEAVTPLGTFVATVLKSSHVNSEQMSCPFAITSRGIESVI
jgi:RAD51-like protein 3